MDQELYGLKARYEAVKQDLNNVKNDMIMTCIQQEKYKEERDDL